MDNDGLKKLFLIVPHSPSLFEKIMVPNGSQKMVIDGLKYRWF